MLAASVGNFAVLKSPADRGCDLNRMTLNRRGAAATVIDLLVQSKIRGHEKWIPYLKRCEGGQDVPPFPSYPSFLPYVVSPRGRDGGSETWESGGRVRR